MTNRTVVVLGGGTGGLVAARRLRRSLDATDRVVLVDRSATYRFAPSLLWVLTGARRPEQISTDRRRLRRSGIEVLEAEVLEIDPAHRKVKTSEAELLYDSLVIALGAELAPDALPGFADAAHNIYTLEGAGAAGAALNRFEGGRLAVVVSRLPYKCPAAPYEAAFLAEALLRHRGARDRTTIDIYTPEPYPMPTAGRVLGDALAAMLAERGITLHPERSVERIDPTTRELVLADGEHVGYDLLLGVPRTALPRSCSPARLPPTAASYPSSATTWPRPPKESSRSATPPPSPSPAASSCPRPACSPKPKPMSWPPTSPPSSPADHPPPASTARAPASSNSATGEPRSPAATSTPRRPRRSGCVGPGATGTSPRSPSRNTG